ncbi:DUF397 domain-containing protein [Streptomyces niveus]|uniref:DUF397 domain-containing protein n=1 Tax=Streptomyces niveus TaxID=193462 RepID=UPI0036BD06CD
MIEPTHIPEENWRSSSYSQSNGGECVQMAVGIPGIVPVRDSKNPTGPVLTLTPTAWAHFVTYAAGGGNS